MAHKATILLAEDEADLATIVRDTLSMLDYRVLWARDGEQAWSLYREQHPDLLVTDVMMPRMDGFSLVRRVRAQDKRLPIIFLTARTDTDDVVSGLRMGGNDYLRKPFAMRELLVRIEILLHRYAPEVAKRLGDEALSLSAPSSAMAREASAQEEALAVGRFVLHRSLQRLV
ncbi:MAG: response regulator, partial [Bacteroidales bacterium]|nr:response regulator [Bacteroidales bacterium]